MKKVTYYVAVSLDGYIAGREDDISLFAPYKPLVDYYLKDLEHFKTVIMGRKTYEFGYNYGLTPGQPAYPGMEHFVFSDSLEFEASHPNVHIEKRTNRTRVIEIRDQSESDVYLCGGGDFAGWMLENELIDILKVKINPILLGEGIQLFGDSKLAVQLEEKESLEFGNGFRIVTYNILY